MSGIDYTVKKVSDEALNEMVQSVAESKNAALEVVTRKMTEAQAEAVRISEQQRRQAEALKRQIIGSAEMTSRNRTLEIIEENLNAAFSQALDKLRSSTSGADYVRIVKSLVLEGIEEVGGNDFVISANTHDQQVLQQVIDAVSAEKGVKISRSASRLSNSVGGVVVSSEDGFVTFDNSYEARLERLKPELRKKIAQLFTGA
ncbi:MAG TPA: V-type ATP synthase subunit E family protein [Nitrososphaerales archaeon]|nr:V-type ATP synthase subunit E family protein [Nitrososphaerales archaeon]